jgi:hypothetical protein
MDWVDSETRAQGWTGSASPTHRTYPSVVALRGGATRPTWDTNGPFGCDGRDQGP